MTRRRFGLGKDLAPFSRRVKDEIAQSPLPRDRGVAAAELRGLFCRALRVEMGEGHPALQFSTTHPGVARRLINLARRVLGTAGTLETARGNRFGRRLTFKILFPGTSIEGIAAREHSLDDPPEELLRAYLRGVFLAGGSINDPRSGYHLELRCGSSGEGRRVDESMQNAGIEGTNRRGDRVYLKDAESISDFLRLIGAARALLRFEDIRVMREVKNRVNRRVNFETANVNKSVEAAIRQMEDLNRLSPDLMDGLSGRTREMMRLRVEHPEASLKEIGEMADPPVTKSTVEYHFRKIRRLVDGDGG